MNWALFIIYLWLSLLSFDLYAETRIAILDFELKDLTLAPGIPAEIARTASIKPLLEKELQSAGYTLVEIPAQAQKTAQSGVGYLFDHADTAARLGKRYGADYLLVGRLHKPSYLFAYLMGNLVDTHSEKWIGHFITESKGPNAQLTIKAVESMTVKLDKILEKRYTPPPPAKQLLQGAP
jgi:hypothetical protein